ncbi:penicillin-binding protein 2 [Kyrpidia spormannii]|uniref:Penicillin-binding protein 2 n=1 Tax=Kyrpidia spormannii TaxID=2055160 RepID=A0A2K8N9F6_9BACL|nr:penicillin-binding protein 2 [Kyrpidia spormannii]ATY85062.1 penicillin-binding protein 2 [Kyrpidia spormannii]
MSNSENAMVRRRRLLLLMSVVVILLGVLANRLVQLQLVESASYKQLADRNRFEILTRPAPRGKIYDRNGQLLVSNKASYGLYWADLTSDENVEKRIANQLAPVLQMTPDAILQKMNDASLGPIWRPIKLGLTDQQRSYVAEHMGELNGVQVVATPERDYKAGTLACHVIGYLNSIGPEQLDSYLARGYRRDEKVGRQGVELSYEKYLRGTDGAFRFMVNAANQPTAGIEAVSPVPGDDVVLTIDARVQQATQQALADQVQKLRSQGVKNAAAVLLDVNTGQVIAMASYPYYDPNWFVNGISQAHWTQFAPAEMNRAIQDPQVPGSVGKLITAIAALQDGVIVPSWTTYDPGYIRINQWTIRDWAAHGTVNVIDAIRESCDTFFYRVGMMASKWTPGMSFTQLDQWAKGPRTAWMKRFQQYQEQFGLGALTGIDLPNEEKGKLMDDGTLPAVYYSAIGQYEQFTPIELAQYTATIANGGKRMEPHVVDRIVAPDGSIVKRIEPKVLNTVPVSPQVLQVVRQGMYQVCNVPSGTAYGAFIGAPYKAAGKTGTAETGQQGYDNSVFVGYAPYDHPEVAAAVVVPGGGHGADSAAIVRKMFDAYFATKGH